MEVFTKGEGRAALRQYGDPHPQGDLDFGDVFGGPPRRFFMEAEEEVRLKLKEKPVFGGKSAAVSWRRPLPVPGDDFFDDIFRGDESSSWRSRRRERDNNLFVTTSKTQHFYSLPARSSIATKVGKAAEVEDGSSSNGLSSPYSSTTSFSRYSNETIPDQDDFRHQIFPQDEVTTKNGIRSTSSRYHFTPDHVKAEFANTFKDSTPKTLLNKQTQSCRWTVPPPTGQMKNHQVDEDCRSNEVYSSKKKLYSSESVRWDAKTIGEDSDYSFEDFFVELLDDPDQDATPGSEASEDTKALDAKIGQWSAGKKGNIRSLLSTLQHVLWAGNEWKAIALVDLVEANPVKRAYQRALLHLHPDKLQQKGAASNQKYIAEKVFDILQEAWAHFNNVALL